MMLPGGWEWIVILAVLVLLFGARKIPELARGLGLGIREFKKASREAASKIDTVAGETSESEKKEQ